MQLLAAQRGESGAALRAFVGYGPVGEAKLCKQHVTIRSGKELKKMNKL